MEVGSPKLLFKNLDLTPIHPILWKVAHQAFQQRFNDELLELGLVHGWAADPSVSSLPGLLISLEDASLPHGLEEVDDAGAADGLALEPRVNPIPHCPRAEALRARPDHPERDLLVVLEDGP